LRRSSLLPLIVLAAPAYAQDLPAEDDAALPEGGDEPGTLVDAATGQPILRAADGEILVIATRIKGQVEGPQEPLLVLDEADIEAYGAEDLADLLSLLSPQTGSGRGRGSGGPITLLNGRRISGFREIQDLPPEAIRRMEILPEEVALRFGYPPNQRVVNFILKDNFASRTVATEYEPATRGGTVDAELEARLVKIDGQKRFNLTGKVNDTSLLTEAERDVIQTEANRPTVAGDPDPAQFRSLVADSRAYSLNGTWSTGLGEGAKAAALTFNGAVTRTDTRSLDGLDTVRLTRNGQSQVRSLPDPLTRESGSTTVEAGMVFNKPLGGWNLTATADGSYGDTRTTIDRPRDTSTLVDAAAAGTLAIDGALPALGAHSVDRGRTRNYGVNSLVTVSGRPFLMPAGEAMLTVKAGFSYNRTENSDTRTVSNISRNSALGRSDLSAGFNLGLPLTSRRNGVLGAIGDLTLNLSAGLDRLSDFGTVTDWSTGLTWAPTEKLNLQASYIVDQAAPGLSQLSSPTLQSFNVTVFDFTRGETALVTVLSGGNPNLQRETQRDLKLSANWQLPMLKNSSLLLEYFRNRSSDVTQGFPLLTQEIETAFPTRVVRDASGRLVSIDRRAVTFDEVKSSRIRWGINLAGEFGKPLPASQREQGFMGMGGGPRGPGGPGAGGPGGGRPGGMGGGMGRGPGGGGGPRGGGPGGANTGKGRWNLSVVHTVELTNTVLIAPGLPLLDQLDGDAIAAGGIARHGVEMEGGGFYRGFGLRFNGSWSAPVTVRSSGAQNADLRFGSVVKLNLRAFLNFDQQKKLVEAAPFLKRARLMFKVDNLLDQRQRVTDAQGDVPLTYQAAYRDPGGRVIGIDFRKSF
jgi:hypothetical protein